MAEKPFSNFLHLPDGSQLLLTTTGAFEELRDISDIGLITHRWLYNKVSAEYFRPWDIFDEVIRL